MDVQGAFDHLATDLRAAANAERAPQMEAYMRDQFVFLGVSSPERKALQRPFIKALKGAEPHQILHAAELCWDQEAREFQSVASDLLRARTKELRAEDLAHLRRFITTKPWWDTVDPLAAHPVGSLVQKFPELGTTIDGWIHDDNIWLARAAILHQLFYKDHVDQDRLFSYVLIRAADTEFFIRKALGWALRSYARVAPDVVRTFVMANESDLSSLTRREALKHL